MQPVYTLKQIPGAVKPVWAVFRDGEDVNTGVFKHLDDALAHIKDLEKRNDPSLIKRTATITLLSAIDDVGAEAFFTEVQAATEDVAVDYIQGWTENDYYEVSLESH